MPLLRDTNSSYLSKDKKDTLQFALKFVINIFCFDEEAKSCALHFVKIFYKKNRINDERTEI